MRAADRNPRTPNHTRLTPAQRQLASKVSALWRAMKRWEAPTPLIEEVASAVVAADWGPFGAYFISSNEPYWAGIDHTYRTLWAQRRPILTIRVWSDGTHTVEKTYSVWETEQYFEEGRARRREAAAQAAEKAAHARSLIGRATPAQRAYMYEKTGGVDGLVDPLVVKYGSQPIDGWEFDGGFLVNGWERLPAHNAVRATVSEEEVARTVRDLRQNAERREREAARARAAGVARIGRGIAEAVWTALCLAKEAKAEAAMRDLRRIHA